MNTTTASTATIGPTTPTRRRSRAANLALLAVFALAGLSGCGVSKGEFASGPTPPPPPPSPEVCCAIDDTTTDDFTDDFTDEYTDDSSDDSSDQGDGSDGSDPADATSVALSSMVDLCELFPLEMAQELLPTLASPAVDPSDPHDPIDYWCSWANPTPAHPEDANPFDKPLRGAGIIESGGSFYGDEVTTEEGEVLERVALDLEGSDYYFGHTSDGGLAIYVEVLSSDGQTFTDFYFGAGENICEAPYESDDCVVDPASDNPEMRDRLVATANELAPQVQELLDQQ